MGFAFLCRIRCYACAHERGTEKGKKFPHNVNKLG